MPAKSKAGKIEKALKVTAGKKGYKGRREAKYVYGTMNKLGLLRNGKARHRIV